MGTHPIFESDFDCLTDRMIQFGLLFSLCAASEIAFYTQPDGISVRTDFSVLTGDMVIDIHRVATGHHPEHVFDQNVFEKFNPFNLAEQSVILVVPQLPTGAKQIIKGDFIAESIELAYPEDAKELIKSSSANSVLIMKTDQKDYSQFLTTITKQLVEQHGGRYILSLVVDTPASGERVVDRQILATESEKDVLGSTEPRNLDFSIIFVISFSLLLFGLFAIVWISYEMIYMEPGDNIAYKLSAAHSKKNL